MAKKAKRKAAAPADDLETQLEARAHRLSVLMRSPMSLADWCECLEKNENGEADDLIEEWRQLSFNLMLCSGILAGDPLPGPAEAQRYDMIADLLACWLDSGTSIDPSPLIKAALIRSSFGENRQPVPTSHDIPDAAWDGWESADGAAEIVLHRAQLRLRRNAGQRRKDDGLSSEAKIVAAISEIRARGERDGLDENGIEDSLTRDEIARLAGVGKTTVVDSKNWKLIMSRRRGARLDRERDQRKPTTTSFSDMEDNDELSEDRFDRQFDEDFEE